MHCITHTHKATQCKRESYSRLCAVSHLCKKWVMLILTGREFFYSPLPMGAEFQNVSVSGGIVFNVSEPYFIEYNRLSQPFRYFLLEGVLTHILSR